MTEYIEREATIELLRSIGSRDYRREKGTIQEAIKMISFSEYTPAADVVEVRHGRWEAWMPDKNGETREFICTGCRFMVEMSWKQKECDYEWCPYCGCKCECLPEPPKEE